MNATVSRQYTECSHHDNSPGARLPLDEAKAAADEAAVPNYMAELSIFQVLLNHPQLARAVNDLLATMLWHGALDPRLRELVIMRIGWLTACDYEWTQHWRVASGARCDGRRPARRTRLAGIRRVRAHRAGGAGGHRRRGARWRGQRRELGGLRTRIAGDETVLIELVTAIGAWRMIASILLSLKVPLEEGVSSWPPDGRSP